jgi:hypothetical protein
MKECILRNYTSEGFKDLTCSYIRENLESIKKKYRDDNGTDIVEAKGSIDRLYREYCKSLDKFFMQCDCVEEPLTCKKCTPEEHEGHFCRCESRNIKLARQLREKKYIGH